MKKNESPVFDSINQCHAMTGLPVVDIRRAKRGGCTAFASHRVNLFALLRWLNGEGRRKDVHVVDVAAAKEADLLESAALKKQKRLEKDGQLVPSEYVNQVLRETLLPVRQRLFAMPSECASNCNPADPQHARTALQSWLETNMPIMAAGTLPDQCPYCGQRNKKIVDK